MRLLMKLVAPLLGWLAYILFRFPLGKKSPAKHRIVMQLFRYAADFGSLKALSVYGHLLLFRGEGDSSRVQGAIYLARAAERNDMKATYQMARIYEQGHSQFAQDDQKAMDCYLRAAEAGHPLAIARLIEIYAQGLLQQPVSQQNSELWKARQADA